MTIKKKNLKNKIVYNNYQFYEIPALTGFIEKQAREGYRLCGAMGNFLDILKFCHVKTEVQKSYVIFRKPETIEKKQNILQGVPLKKSIAYVSILLMISVIAFVLKVKWIEKEVKWIEKENLHFNLLNLGLCLTLLINFFFYFIGDLHDLILGKGISIDGKIYFSDRTKLKDILFRIGDILKFGILLGIICMSIAFLLNAKDATIVIYVLKIWFIYCFIGFTSRIKFQRSYISLLLIEVFLITL